MKHVLILGANGQIARWVIDALAADRNVSQTLLVRHPGKLGDTPSNARVVTGDVLDRTLLLNAMQGQDIVYANLAGANLDAQAASVIAAMQAAGVERLVFVLSLGIYDEVPGKFGDWNNAIIGEDLKPYRRAADAIEASGLQYTILRPAWLTDEDEVDYELTGRNEPFKGTVVSRKSVADLIVRIVAAPELHLGENLGIDRPGSDGDKPYFM
ncbi:SDR family oxidoreductase [Burkholderia pseudomultivorans]|uniref:SDR family oxidoreductase n=1 Tax=Burkholderia pseudomultivorans TaxID=1207504 RepID=UPI000758B164|nr:SDR family oxidoreductase [Burkholderia pseudomultivorans]KVC23386.1 NAD-dependent dehydratase [Burkholderia pseudomultivorans]KVC36755.1 NAD-dependent dehydratase [Burkholderia pseudomultivorans]MDS0791437.1 SDR family oxidoreductase [Burkholderia pseudomultivorans]